LVLRVCDVFPGAIQHIECVALSRELSVNSDAPFETVEATEFFLAQRRHLITTAPH